MKKNNTIKRATGSVGLINHFRSLMAIGLLLVSAFTFGQIDTTLPAIGYITGTVFDASSNEPVMAAQIQNLNNEAAATTDENGNFKILISSKHDILLVKAIDYNATEVPLKLRDSITVGLYRNLFTENYYEFDILTGKNRASFVTSSSNKIIKKDKLQILTADDLLLANMGSSIRAINRSGNTEMGAAMYIRGLNSLLLNAQPLVIVDGVPWNNYSDVNSIHGGFTMNPLSMIDKNDIESITVVKDGTSIYGSKAGNGVILIKTKRGRDLATKIIANISGGFIERPKAMPLLNGDQYKILVTDLLETQGLTPQAIDELEYLTEDQNSSSYKLYHNSTDWEDEIYQNGISQKANISVNGGDERALYAFSIGYTGNKGNVLSSNSQRLNTRFNADFFLSEKIDMGLNVGFTNIDNTLLDDGVNFYTSPSYLAMIKAKFLNPYKYTAMGSETTDFEDADVFNVGNPLAIIDNALNTNKRYRLNLGLKPVIHLTQKFSLSNQFDYSLFKVKETHYDPILGTADRYISGYGYSANLFQNQVIKNIKFYNNTQVKYKSKIGIKHHLVAMAGIRYMYDSFNSDFAEGHNSGSDQVRKLLPEEEYKTLDGINFETKSLALYLNADYNFSNRYFFNFSTSIDGSSRFGTDTEEGFQMFGYSWGIFPSINAAWLVSSESFMATLPFIDLLKIRAGYGISGNDEIDPFGKAAYFSTIRFIDRSNGLYLSNIGNSKLQWETTNKMNIGIDINVLNNLLAVSADLYSNSTTNLIHLNQLPDVIGPGYYWANGGELTNKGFEVGATIKALNLNKLQWEIGGSVGHYKNNITSLPDGDITTAIYNADILSTVNNPAGVFYGYTTNGVFTTAAEAKTANLRVLDEYGNETFFEAGDMHFTDLNSDGIIDESDKQIIGDPNPDIYGSFNSAITYGNFTLDALFTFSYGNEIYNYLRACLESGNGYLNQTTAMLNRWTYEGQKTEMPKAFYDDPMGNARFSDRWIEDGSYLKIKTVSLSYKVPINSNLFDQLTVWASANNLFTLTNYLGRDPEFSVNNSVLYQGIDAGLIPSSRSYLIGVKLNL
jgi:TonB-linked SusC/RagA family outer membrane protein